MPGRNVPFPPMEAQLVRTLPDGDDWQYEPKWDGFRGVLENDGGELALWSRNERPLLRYFPELRPLGELLPPHSALDGEMDYVGSCAVAARTHDDVARRLLPLLEDAPDRHFSEPNRWGTGELEEAAVRPELVVEVRYDKVQGNRFRHGTKLLRWRDDKDPKDCTWRELRPARDPKAPTIESFLAK